MDLEYVTPETLRNMLENPDLLIIDLRLAGSRSKIPGGIWRDRDQVAAWAPTLPRDKPLVLY